MSWPSLSTCPSTISMRIAGGRTGKRAITIEDLELVDLTFPFSVEVHYGERIGPFSHREYWDARARSMSVGHSGAGPASGTGAGAAATGAEGVWGSAATRADGRDGCARAGPATASASAKARAAKGVRVAGVGRGGRGCRKTRMKIS